MDLCVAVLGILIFAVLVAIAARNEDFHIGFAALFAALIFGVFGSGLTVDAVLLGFPTELFLTLVAVTMLFAIAETNGTLGIIAERSIQLCHGRVRLVPLIVFALAFTLSALGVGNIAATALLAGTAMKLAQKLKINAFLMSLTLVGGANAASLSPFSLSGILLADLMQKAIPEADGAAIHAAAVKIFFLTLILITLIHFIGFLFCGGYAWWKTCGRAESSSLPTGPTIKMNWSQRATLSGIFIFAACIILGNSAYFAQIFGTKWQEVGSQSLIAALGLIVCLMVGGVVKTERAAAKIPWTTIMLISGVITYLGVLEHAGAIALASDLFQSKAVFGGVIPSLAFSAAALSSISSSSGVVLPLFIPMVTGLASDSWQAFTLIATIAISSHLVDCSPFSTLGALCLASAKEAQTLGHRGLFRQLLFWGLAMIPTALLLMWLLAPSLGHFF